MPGSLIQVRTRERGATWTEWQDISSRHCQDWLRGALEFAGEGTVRIESMHGDYEWKVISPNG